MKKNTIIHKILKQIRSDKIFIYSSHASFYILISAIPFITLLIFLIKEFVTVTERDISNTLLPFLPSYLHHAGKIIINEIFYKESFKIISFSLLSLLWTASRGISAIRRGLSFIYNVKAKPFILDAITAILWVIPTIFFVIFLLTFSIFLTIYLSIIPKIIIGIALLSVFFSTIYYIFSSKTFPLKSHLPGGFFSSLLWISFIRIFSFYINNFANYSYVYGSLTAVLLLALWIYFSTIIFFLGAELNKYIVTSISKKRTV